MDVHMDRKVSPESAPSINSPSPTAGVGRITNYFVTDNRVFNNFGRTQELAERFSIGEFIPVLVSLELILSILFFVVPMVATGLEIRDRIRRVFADCPSNSRNSVPGEQPPREPALDGFRR